MGKVLHNNISEINKIHTANSWKYFHDESAIEGLVSIAYNYHHKKYALNYFYIDDYINLLRYIYLDLVLDYMDALYL